MIKREQRRKRQNEKKERIKLAVSFCSRLEDFALRSLDSFVSSVKTWDSVCKKVEKSLKGYISSANLLKFILKKYTLQPHPGKFDFEHSPDLRNAWRLAAVKNFPLEYNAVAECVISIMNEGKVKWRFLFVPFCETNDFIKK